MTTLRFAPKPDPRTRDNWRVEVVDERTESGLVLFEYAVRERPGVDPFILNNHKAQHRANHQRIARGPSGGLMHVSGIEVMDVEEFEKDSRFYRWVDKDRSGRWRDSIGRVLAPFIFPTAPWAGGLDEELDPQWVRERFTVSLASQRDEAVRRYLDRAALKGWEGDKRGTTLNLQVGAGADDAYELADGTGFTAVATTIIMSSSTAAGTRRNAGFRFAGVTIAGGATINTAVLQLNVDSTFVDDPNVDIYGNDVDDAVDFTGEADVTSRAVTTASAAWVATGIGTGFKSSPDIAAVIQEIIDRAGWASGNDLMPIVRGKSDADKAFRCYAYETSSANAAKLDIDYTAGGATAVKDLIGGGIIPFAR